MQVSAGGAWVRVGGSGFLQTDPVPGGSANNYDYAAQDPVSNYDLDGRQLMCSGGGIGPIAETQEPCRGYEWTRPHCSRCRDALIHDLMWRDRITSGQALRLLRRHWKAIAVVVAGLAIAGTGVGAALLAIDALDLAVASVGAVESVDVGLHGLIAVLATAGYVGSGLAIAAWPIIQAIRHRHRHRH